MITLDMDEVREQWTADYIAENDATVREETLGRQLASWSSWDGVRILRVASAALTDANFHDEADQIDQMINQILNG